MKRERMKRKVLKDDRKGVLDLPFKLIIMMLLMATVLPVGMMGYKKTSRARYERKVKDELRHLASMCQRLSIEGNLSSTEITLDLDGDIFTSLSYLHIGDSLGGEDWLLDYRFSWREKTDYLAIHDPVVHLTSPTNNTLRLKGGETRLKLTNCIQDGSSYIKVDQL